MKHTVGNWKIDDTIDNTISVVSPWSDKVKPEETATFGDYRGALICEMYYNTGVPTKGQALANAKLIAAAPDLLQALIILKKWVGKLDDWKGEDPPCELVDKAIDKATK